MKPRLCRRQLPTDVHGPTHLLHVCIMHKHHAGVHLCLCGWTWRHAEPWPAA